MTKRGKENPNWRGGRIVSSHGYILVRVGKEHHLADIRGYAYEHRIIMEEKLGRRLQAGELVHHLNHDKADNRPENLVAANGNAEHYIHHRKRNDLRLPSEPNPLIGCECGCGQMLRRYDTSGRPRKYVSGHNPHPAATQQEILRILELGSLHRQRIADLCRKPIDSIATALSILKKRGFVRQVSRGVWSLREVDNGNQDKD